jgi:hypothetical protein
MTSLIRSFGSIKFNTQSTENLKDYVIDIRDEEKLKRFQYICDCILSNKYSHINRIEINRLTYDLFNTHLVSMHKNLVQSIDNFSIGFRDNIRELVLKKEFNYDFFIESYRHYFTRIDKLKSVLWYFEKNIKNVNTQGATISYFDLIRTISFYKNVLSEKYNFEGEEMNLGKVFGVILESDFKNIEKINPVLGMLKFYEKLYTLTSDKTLFVEKIGVSTLMLDGHNKNFIKNFVIFIDKKIKEYSHTSTKVEKFNIKKIIFDIMNLILETENRSVFEMYYFNFFRNRILNDDCDLIFERDILLLFKDCKNIATINKMLNMIRIIKKSFDESEDGYKYLFKTVVVKSSSDKYKDFDSSRIDRDIDHTKFVSYFHWDNIDNTQVRYNLPKEVETLVDMNTALYESLNKDRTIKWNYDHGTSIVQMTMNEVEYNIQLTIPQMAVIMLFRDFKEISAQQISETTDIPLFKLGNVLNSLLRSKILVKESGPSSDPNLKFSLNSNFNSENKNISLVNLMKVNMREVCSFVANIIRKFTKLTETQIIDISEQEFTNGITRELIMKAIQIIIDRNIIELKDGNYQEIIEEDTDSDDFTDSDSD